jgi:hypothetical protein
MLALHRRSRPSRSGLVCSARPSRSGLECSACPSRWALVCSARPSRAVGSPQVSGERGMVTAEFAVVLPAVVLVLALSLGALGLALDQISSVDAARAGARAASRGDSDSAVILVSRRAAPSQALVSIDTSGELVRVSVVSRPRVAGNLLPAWLRAGSTASAAREPADPR